MPLVSIIPTSPVSLSNENKSHRKKLQDILFAGLLSPVQSQKYPNHFKHNQTFSMPRSVTLLTVLC